MKKLFIALTLVCCLTGCEKFTPEGKKAVAEGAKTAAEISKNFEVIKDRITAKNPEEAILIEEWKNTHSQSLKAGAKALEDVSTLINKK